MKWIESHSIQQTLITSIGDSIDLRNLHLSRTRVSKGILVTNLGRTGNPTALFQDETAVHFANTELLFIERQNLPGLFRTFDFPSPDATVPARFVTTVPQQGLFMLNSSFAAARSRAVAKRVAGAADDAAKIRELYRILFQRDPSPREERLGLAFVSSADSDAGKADALESWELYAQTLLFSNELAFIY